MPYFGRLPVVALFLVLGTALQPAHLAASGKVGGYDRALYGRDKFNFYLMTQYKNMERNAGHLTEVPIFSIEGSPLYDGVKRVGKEEIRVVSTLKNIQDRARLLNSVQPTTRGEWLNDSLQVKLSPGSIEKFLEHIGKDFNAFKSIASGMTRDKAQLLYQLLFSDSLKLSSEAFEEIKKSKDSTAELEATFEALSRSSKLPAPDPTRVPIKINDGDVVWNMFLEWIFDIYVDSLVLHFQEKEVWVDPVSNSLRVRIKAKGAELSGKARRIGRFPYLISQMIPETPFWYDNSIVQVKNASIGAFQVDFGFQFRKNTNGFWMLHFLDPKRPLILRMLESKPVVIEYQNGGKSPPISLSEKVVGKIESVLSGTLLNAFKASFFPDDFGTRLNVSLPFYEDLEPKTVAPQVQNSQFEAELSELKFESDGVGLHFNTRVNVFKTPECLSNFSEAAKAPDLPHSGSERAKNSQGWSLKSVVEEKSISNWRLSGDSQAAFSYEANVEARKGLLESLSRASLLGGLYCVSTRAFWPRAGHLPLIEFRPTKMPTFSLGNQEISAEMSGELISYARETSDNRDYFKEESRKPLETSLKFTLDPSTQAVIWTPGEIRYSDSPIENELLSHFADSLVRPLLGLDEKNRAPLGSDLVEKFSEGGLSLKDFRVEPEKVFATLRIGNFDWMKSISFQKEKEEQTVVEPKTVKISEEPIEVSRPSVEIRWQENKNLFFSWRKRHLEDKAWGNWISFAQTDRANVSLDKPGRYYVQVRSMNRKFQVEQDFVQYEPYYQEPIEQIDLMQLPSVISKPKEDEPRSKQAAHSSAETKPPVQPVPLSSKGLFGCSLQGEHRLGLVEVLFALAACLLCLLLRRKSI